MEKRKGKNSDSGKFTSRRFSLFAMLFDRYFWFWRSIRSEQIMMMGLFANCKRQNCRWSTKACCSPAKRIRFLVIVWFRRQRLGSSPQKAFQRCLTDIFCSKHNERAQSAWVLHVSNCSPNCWLATEWSPTANKKTNSRGTPYGLSQHTYTAEQRIEETGVVRNKSRESEPFLATLTLEDGRIREKAHFTLMLPPLLRMFRQSLTYRTSQATNALVLRLSFSCTIHLSLRRMG